MAAEGLSKAEIARLSINQQSFGDEDSCQLKLLGKRGRRPMKTLRVATFQRRPRFDDVAGTVERLAADLNGATTMMFALQYSRNVICRVMHLTHRQSLAGRRLHLHSTT